VRIPVAPEGIGIVVVASVICAAVGAGLEYLWWPLSLPVFAIWVWVISFFRDPRRVRNYVPGEFCAPADGTMTEITRLDHHELIGGPAVRMGMFLSLFNVHANRSPCAGRVRSIDYRKGLFLDARHPESGEKNESNTLVIEPSPPLAGPIVVRQVAGLVARRIVCHARPGDSLSIGERFGMIKFGSRTELIIPLVEGTEIMVKVGDKVKAGLTIMARQRVAARGEEARITKQLRPELLSVTNIEARSS